LEPLVRHEVDFVVIGSIAGIVHGSAYPTYDLDLVYAAGSQDGLASVLNELTIQVNGTDLGRGTVHSFETQFGTVDILREIPAIASYSELKRDSRQESIAGVQVRVASLDHLIAMKRASNRVKDRIMLLEYVELADEVRRRAAEGET